VCWRLEREIYFAGWEKGEGAYQVGGRFSSKGRRVIYTSLDPSTAIVELAVHKGFRVLDTDAHVLMSIAIPVRPGDAMIVQPTDVGNPNWLRPGLPSANQQKFGDTQLDKTGILILPSVVSSHSWNCLIDVATFPKLASYLQSQERFALETRLIPAA
jgi:RES domain-containing protein